MEVGARHSISADVVGKTVFDFVPAEFASTFHAEDLRVPQLGETVVRSVDETVDFSVRPASCARETHALASATHRIASLNFAACHFSLSHSDMCFPIQYAVTWPERVSNSLRPLDLAALGRLDFEAPRRSDFLRSISRAALGRLEVRCRQSSMRPTRWP